MKNSLKAVAVATISCAAIAVAANAAGGAKRTAEQCTIDDDCARGHCYTKKSDGNKVCVDCSSSTMSDLRGQVTRFCKDEVRGCNDIPRGDEVSEKYFSIRIENGERCINARKNENSQCWDGGDRGHKTRLTSQKRRRRSATTS